jgi:hypothetical protein
VNLCLPFAKGTVAKFHARQLFVVATPSSVAPSNTVTMLFASANPIKARTAACP